jgi:cytochrome b561
MLRNSTFRWGWFSKLMHWLAALAILVLLVHGWWMTHMTPRPERLANYAWHSALGFDLLALVVLRLLWRWVNPVPELPSDLRAWERMAVHLGHFGLYLLMFAASLTGWVLAGTMRVPVARDLFGIYVPPLMSGIARPLRNQFESAHMILAYLLAALAVVHVIGALRHHFWKKNEVLRRMTWGLRSP